MVYILKKEIQAELTHEDIERLIDLEILEETKTGELSLVASNFVQSNANCVKKEFYNEIISYLNEKAGSKYRSNVKATQELINGRVREGYSMEDFKKVIDYCCSEWLHRPEMKPYLRPSTLFRPSKFESYLFQAETTKGYLERVTSSASAREVSKEYGVLLEW